MEKQNKKRFVERKRFSLGDWEHVLTATGNVKPIQAILFCKATHVVLSLHKFIKNTTTTHVIFMTRQKTRIGSINTTETRERWEAPGPERWMLNTWTNKLKLENQKKKD